MKAVTSLAVAAVFSSLVACNRGGGDEPLRDLSMLELMTRLNAVHLGMEPYLRSPSHLEDLAGGADGVAQIAADELMTSWIERPDFGRNPEPWKRFRADLQSGAEAAAVAARAGDLDALHAAYTQMDATCVGCHKRYQPNY